MTYRGLEFVISYWKTPPWNIVAQHTLPPLGMLGLALLFWRLVPRLPPRGKGADSDTFGPAIAVGMLLGGLVALCNLLMTLATRAEGGFSGVASLDPSATALVAHVVLLAPVAEEVTFRGLIYRIFRHNMSPFLAVLLSAVIFGLMHVQLDKAIWAFFLGLVAASAYEQTRSLMTPILIHMLFNAVPVGVAVLQAKPDDTGPIWLVLATVAIIFTCAAQRARSCGDD